MAKHFSPLNVSIALLEPIEYFFTHYATPDLKYSKNDKETKIEIGTVNDFHKIVVESLPRILVDRGPYELNSNHLNESLAESDSFEATLGLKEHVKHVFINGQVSITIEARQEGVCEKITDMVATMLSWTQHEIARDFGFKKFAGRINIGSCSPFEDGETSRSFRCVVTFPYSTEETWNLDELGVKIKSADLNITSTN